MARQDRARQEIQAETQEKGRIWDMLTSHRESKAYRKWGNKPWNTWQSIDKECGLIYMLELANNKSEASANYLQVILSLGVIIQELLGRREASIYRETIKLLQLTIPYRILESVILTILFVT